MKDRHAPKQHAVWRLNGWAVVGGGSTPTPAVELTQGKAIEPAHWTAQHQASQVVLQGREGKIREIDRYENNSCHSKDTRH